MTDYLGQFLLPCNSDELDEKNRRRLLGKMKRIAEATLRAYDKEFPRQISRKGNATVIKVEKIASNEWRETIRTDFGIETAQVICLMPSRVGTRICWPPHASTVLSDDQRTQTTRDGGANMEGLRRWSVMPTAKTGSARDETRPYV